MIVFLRLEVYSARASSLQANSHTKMGKLQLYLFPKHPLFLCSLMNVPDIVLLFSSLLRKFGNWMTSKISWVLWFVQVISAFTLISVIFIPIGVASLLASRDVCLRLKQSFILLVYCRVFVLPCMFVIEIWISSF